MSAPEIEWPDWWHWEIAYTSHLSRRMRDRGFTLVDLHVMMEEASGWCPSGEEGRYVIQTTLGGAAWELIVEPDEIGSILFIVTAYAVT